MKKPNITIERGYYFDLLCINDDYKEPEELKEMIEKMIDALIEAHKFLVVTPANMRNNRGERPIEAFNKIEIAFKKAGCEL